MKTKIPRSPFFNLRALVGVLLSAATACSILTETMLAFSRREEPTNVSHATAAELTFEARVSYQRVIEGACWRHHNWPKERLIAWRLFVSRPNAHGSVKSPFARALAISIDPAIGLRILLTSDQATPYMEIRRGLA